MDAIKELKLRLAAGSITRKYFNLRALALLEDGEITAGEYQEALNYDPQDDDEQRAAQKAQALEMMGIISPMTKKKIVDPVYAAKLADTMDMIGIKPRM